MVSRIRFICDRRASLVDEAASRRAALSSSRALMRSAMRFLVASSGASSNLRLSKARCSSTSESLATLFVCSPRIVSRARQTPRNSRCVIGGGGGGGAGLFWHSEDRSRGLNSGLGLYNGLPKILKLDYCVHGLRHLAQFLVGSVEVCNRLAREAGALVDAQRLSHIYTIPFESRGFEELPRPVLVG